jgi:hypothetical protein
MRALRVVGLSEDGKSVVCEDLSRGERFLIPADERLRAAARGDLTRLGQIEIELESQMRPREIQARIRAGESVEQLAEAAGLPINKVERFAYPVLLERSRTAELAQRAHPVREEGPDVQTLTEVVAHAFGLRGQDYATVAWDSWRGEDGKWVVQLQWTTGRSENRAHWAFHPGAHGGTVLPLDDHALDLMDPNAAQRPLRTVRPVTELARQALEPGYDTAPPAAAEFEVLDAEVVEDTQVEADTGYALPPAPEPEPEPEPEPAPPAAPVAKPTPVPVPPKPAVTPVTPVAPVAKPVTPVAKPVAPVAKPVAPGAKPAAKPGRPSIPPITPVAKPGPTPVPQPAEPATPPAAAKPAAQRDDTPAAPAAKAEPDESTAPEETTARKPEPPKRGKKNHPIVPSWEDVLLGVRGQRG